MVAPDGLGPVIAAIDDPVRRRVVELLNEGPRRSGDLASVTGTHPTAMSRHLRVLLEAGLVEDERSRGDARVRLFFLRRERFAVLTRWLADIELAAMAAGSSLDEGSDQP